jgi:hypothetical protein
MFLNHMLYYATQSGERGSIVTARQKKSWIRNDIERNYPVNDNAYETKSPLIKPYYDVGKYADHPSLACL